MNSSVFAPQKPSWKAVAEIANSQLGRRYSGVYCREVSDGYRTNSKLEPILRDLGVMDCQRTKYVPEPEFGFPPEHRVMKPLTAKQHRELLAESAARVREAEAAGTLCQPIEEVDLLSRHRRTLARHLRDALVSNRTLRADLAEARAEVDVLRGHIASVTSDRDSLRQRLDEAHRTADRLTSSLLASRSTARRTTHVCIAGTTYANRTGAKA